MPWTPSAKSSSQAQVPRSCSSRKARVRSSSKKPDPSATERNANKAEKVVGFMIDNMVKVLHDDDVNDEHKKDWCANETASMQSLMEEKVNLKGELEKNVEVLEGEIEQLKADIKGLEEDINTNDQ